MDNDGRLISHGRVENSLEDTNRFSNSLPPSTNIAVVSSSTWYWSYKLLSSNHKVSLSNPVKNKAIAFAKVKTDRIDSLTLAELLRGGYTPECYIPDVYTQKIRELVRYRARLVRLRTIVKNSIHAHLLMYNIKVEGYSFTESFKERLRGLGDPKIIGYMKILSVFDNRIHEASETIK
jgi:transposase